MGLKYFYADSFGDIYGKYVLDADIAGCFANINHDVLLSESYDYKDIINQC